MSNRKKATDWFERLPTSDPKSLGIRHNKINLGKTYYPSIDFRTLTGEQIEKIWFEETGGDSTIPDAKITEWWETIPNAKYSSSNDPTPNRAQLLCKYFEDGATRAITPETLRYIYENEHDRGLMDSALKLKYDKTNLFEVNLRIQPDIKVTTDVIIETLSDLYLFIAKKGWRVRFGSGKDVDERYVKMNVVIDGVKYRIPCKAEYHQRGTLHSYVYEPISALGTSHNSKEEALEELQKDIDLWVKIHTFKIGDIKEMIFTKVISSKTIHLFEQKGE